MDMITDIGRITGKIGESSMNLLRPLVQNSQQCLASDDPVPTAYLIWKDPLHDCWWRHLYPYDMLRLAGYRNLFAGRTGIRR